MVRKSNLLKLEFQISYCHSYELFCFVFFFSDRPKLVFFDLLTCSKMGRDVESLGCPTPQVNKIMILYIFCRAFALF